MEDAYSSISSSIKKAPWTPRSMSSPFMDAFRTAQASATKEFDQFYGYISKVMTPRRSQPQSNSRMIRKPLAPTAKRIRQYNDKDILSLTPSIDRRPPSTEIMPPYLNDRYIKSPSRHHHQHNENYYPLPQPLTLSPTTLRTYSELDNSHSDLDLLDQQQQRNDDQITTNVYSHTTPQRSTPVHDNSHSFRTGTPHSQIMHSTTKRKLASITSSSEISPSLCPSTPSVILQDGLQDESRRLEQLQHDVLIVQQQSLALSYLGKLSTTHQQSRDRLFGNTTGPRQRQRQHSHPTTTSDHQLSYTHSSTPTLYRRHSPHTILTYGAQTTSSSSLLLTPVPAFITSTPLGSPSTTTKNQFFSAPSDPHLLPPMPKSTAPSSPSSANSSIQPVNDSPTNATSSSSQQRFHQHQTMDDIPKMSLRPYKTISTPTRSKLNNNNNKFWAEIQHLENEALPPLPLSSNQLNHRRKLSSPPPPPLSVQAEHSDVNWIDVADNEHQWDVTARTLDQELGMANEKFDALHQQQQQQHIESKSFSLRPSGAPPFVLDDDDDDNTPSDGRIDGDRWTFAGQHYTLDEKKKQ